MLVHQLMKTTVARAQPAETLQNAARRMIEANLGILPVCDPDSSGKVVGVLTDRDICRYACELEKPLDELSVAAAMTRSAQCCSAQDSLRHAQRLMAESGVHRLPVVDDDGGLVGLISLSDIAAEAERLSHLEKQEVTAAEVAATLAAIGSLQQPR